MLCAECDKVFVIDNTAARFDSPFPESKKVTVVKPGTNIGLAAALNRGMRLAGQSGFENIFLFDQDSRQPGNFFQDMLAFKARAEGTGGNFAFYVPDFFDRNSKTFATFPVIRRFTLRHRKCKDLLPGGPGDAIMAVTSGTLLKYSAFRELGPFREDYFIDFIDNEYCLRAYKLGYRVAVNCGVVLDHAIGRRAIRKISVLTLKPNFHSPLRRYYIARNGLRTALEFGCDRPAYLPLFFARLCHEILSIILIEDGKAPKLKGLAYGLLHGFTRRMGACGLVSLKAGGRSDRLPAGIDISGQGKDES